MSTLSRKQREVQQREELILDVAQRMLLEEGYAGLSMDRIAETIEYAKGTVYKHFTSKDDVLAAIVVRNLEQRLRLFERAAAFPGRTRERMVAVVEADELYYHGCPYHYRALQIIQVAAMLGKTAGERQARIGNVTTRLLALITGIVRDAIAHGDIEFAFPRRPEELVFGVWSLVFGARAVTDSPAVLGQLAIGDPTAVSRLVVHAVLDAFNWHPLSNEWDYEATRERIRKETFADEIRQLRST